MADSKEQLKKAQLQEEGYTAAEADEVFARAADLHSKTLLRDDTEEMTQDDLEDSAERAGIPEQFVEEAIRQLRVERREQEARQKQEAAQQAARQRQIKKIALIAAPIIVLFAILAHSVLNRQFTNVEEKRAQLDNVLERRRDLIPNLIALSRASAPQEQELGASLTALHRRAGQAPSPEQRLEIEAQLGQQAKELMTAMGRDPRASSVASFMRLSDEMAGAENRIAVERKRYNEAVAGYNRTVRGFPMFLLRPFLGFPGSLPYFQASPDSQQALTF